jgi:hypothetical protein
MALITRSLRTPLIEFRSTLACRGLRTREDYDELVLATSDCDVRLSLGDLDHGQLVRCFISVMEARLRDNGLELLNELALEGHPIVAYGAGHGQATFEFEWRRSEHADWRIAGERLELLINRISATLGPKPLPMRQRRKRRLPTEILEGVLAHAVSAV